MPDHDELVCGLVKVAWGPNDSIISVTYDNQPLTSAVNARLKLSVTLGSIILNTELKDLIDHLLAAIAALQEYERRRKTILADCIFGQLFIKEIPGSPPNPKLRSLYWKAILDHVWGWEDKNEIVHKGTPYYFMAESYLESGDIPSAYICFYNAVEQDKAMSEATNQPNSYKSGPAYKTISLVDNSDNRLYENVVVPLRQDLASFLDRYNTRTAGTLSLQMLDQKFLQVDDLEDAKRFFVANLHEIHHLAPLNSTRMINNDYSKLKIIDTLFNLGLIVDQILEYRFRDNLSRKDMANAVFQLALKLGWTNSQSKDAGNFIAKVVPNLNTGSPDTVLPPLLDGTATLYGRSLNQKQRAIFAAYHLRNYGGHHLEGNTIFVNRYVEILDLVMDSFFVSVETLP